jgi:hypothetical protein
MYGLPSDFDGRVFTGRILEQVCFNENQVTLSFDGDMAVMVESAFSYEAPPAESRLTEVPVFHSDLMRLLGRRVSSAVGDEDGTLVLVFENGHRLRILDDSREYESYRIRLGKKMIIV